MRTKILVLLLIAGAASSACVGDALIDYTVVNSTNQDLITWPTFRSCSASGLKKQDYWENRVVPRQTSYHYELVIAERGPGCLQVATTDRRLVLSRPLVVGATVTITEPVAPFGDPVPEPNQLANKTGWEELRDSSTGFKIGLAVMAFGVLAGFVAVSALILTGIFFAGRWTVRRIRA